MLTPRYLESAPDAMVDLYSEVEADILADMARRIARYDFFIPAAEHQLRVLEEMGAEQTYILRRLAELTGRSEAELRQLFEVSGGKALVSDQADYRRAGLHPPALNTSQELQQVLSAGLRQTQGLFTNLTRTTALDSGERFRAVLDRAWLQVSTGGFDANTAIRNAIKELTRQGLTTVDYASGRTMSVEAAVRMNVVTGVNQTALRLQDTLADEMDSDLVETTAHSGARPSHARWQGQVFSRSGKSKKYPDFRRATGYGTGPGLGGWNCRHSFHPYFDGMARTYGAKELKKLEAKSITYNGEKLTEYEASQRQRYIERQIRRWKREQQAMKSAGQPQEEAKAKLKEWRARQTDLVEQTGLKRQYAHPRPGLKCRDAPARSGRALIRKIAGGKGNSMNYEYLKPFFEGGPLSFEQLTEKLDAADGVKLANLKDGGYVGKDKFDALEARANGLQAQLSEANGKLEGYDPEWKAKAQQMQQEANQKVEAVRFDYALKAALTAAKAKNPELVAKSINRDALKLTDAGLVGLEEQLKALKESDGYLFEGDKPAPEIVKPGSPIRRTPAGGGDLDDFYANNPFYKKKA